MVLVTILILVDGFLQLNSLIPYYRVKKVTILILVDGFLQCESMFEILIFKQGHNPYFSRWFSAIY